MAELQGRVRLACGSPSLPGSERLLFGSLGAARPLLAPSKSFTRRWRGRPCEVGPSAVHPAQLASASVSVSLCVSACVRVFACARARCWVCSGSVCSLQALQALSVNKLAEILPDAPQVSQEYTAPSASAKSASVGKSGDLKLKKGDLAVGGLCPGWGLPSYVHPRQVTFVRHVPFCLSDTAAFLFKPYLSMILNKPA